MSDLTKRSFWAGVFNDILSKRYQIVLFLFIFSFTKVYAQENINAGGNSKIEGNISVSYSIGQTFVQAFSSIGELVFVTPGVQQWQNRAISTGHTNNNSQLVELKVYPNPVIDLLNVSIIGLELQQAKLLLYNLNGEAIAVYEIENHITSITASDLPAGIYVAKLINMNRQVALLKFIKK